VKIFSISKREGQTVTPWKNGGGETTQLAIFPPGSSLEAGDFLWRVSRARIQKSGPYSEFVGFSRGLVQLSGEPIKLGTTKLHRFEPFLFLGDQPIHCELGKNEAATEVIDVNVLVNRAWGQFKMSSYAIEKGKRLARYGDFVAYYCHEGVMDVDGTEISAGELIVLEEDSMVQAITDLNLVVIELTKNSRY
jgi:uncharacterized protein